MLGLEESDTVETLRPVPNIYLPGGPPVQFRGAFFRVPGQALGYLDWLEHRDAGRRHPPYREGQHVGIIRCALEVADIDAASDALGLEITDRRFGAPLGLRPTIDVLDPEGVRYQLIGPARH